MPYLVEITVTNSIVKQVDATSAEDAVRWVSALYKAGEIKVSHEDNPDYKITCIGEGEL